MKHRSEMTSVPKLRLGIGLFWLGLAIIWAVRMWGASSYDGVDWVIRVGALGAAGMGYVTWAILARFRSVDIDAGTEITIKLDEKIVWRGSSENAPTIVEDGVGFHFTPREAWPQFFIDRRLLSEGVKQWIRGGMRKTGEPGATDNPDDAQRLREDH